MIRRLPWQLRGYKESACDVGELGSIPGAGQSPEAGHSTTQLCVTLRSNGL